MPAPERRTGPWGEAIQYWLRERRLRQADLVKGTKIEAKTISRMARGFHTQTRKLELIAQYLGVALERILVSPLRVGPGEDRRQAMRRMLEDAFRIVESGADPTDADALALGKRIQSLRPESRNAILKLLNSYEVMTKPRRRSSRKPTKKSPSS